MSKDYIIVHVTATPPSMPEVDDAWVDIAHKRRGFRQCGYQAVITRPDHPTLGAVIQTHMTGGPCRPLHDTAAAVGGCGPGWNSRTLNVSMVGGVDEGDRPEDNMTPEQYALLFDLIRNWQEVYGIPDENVLGHRDLIKMTGAPPKACPCFSVQGFISQEATRFGGSFNPNADTLEEMPAENTSLTLPREHKVRRAETLWGISRLYGIAPSDLYELNKGIDNLARIRPGDLIRLR